jgi:carboxyl-terminal processing protease
MTSRSLRPRSTRTLAISVSLFALSAVAGPVQAQDSLRATTRHRTIAEDLQLFSQVLNQIRVNHPDSLDTHELLMAAIEGMVSAADPHSYVVPFSRLDSAKEVAMRDGKLYPVPIDFRFVGGAPLVVGVAPGSRAVSLDILPGDELIAADGHPIAATSVDELDIALAGAKNSNVSLTFRRRRSDGSVARLERSVRREREEEASAVPVATMLANSTGYVRVTTFVGDKVADQLHDALGDLEKQGMTRLVLDLRGNGGGRVDEANRIAGEFLPRGTIIYTATGRKADVTDTGRVQRSFFGSQRTYPIALLVDEGTASASELVAGALQDHDRAIIVGRTTFGKSLEMRTFPLSDGSRMTLVVGRLRTPCGRVIQRDYHSMSRREYYMEAGESTTSSERPSCKTDHGRTVYGGGGIVPDVVLDEPLTPIWRARLGERALALTWAGGYVDRKGATLTTVENLASSSLDAATLAEFRAYASQNGVVIPDDAESTSRLTGYLVREIAFVKFGDAGLYRLIALTDPAVAATVKAFDRAGELLSPTKPD